MLNEKLTKFLYLTSFFNKLLQTEPFCLLHMKSCRLSRVLAFVTCIYNYIYIYIYVYIYMSSIGTAGSRPHRPSTRRRYDPEQAIPVLILMTNFFVISLHKRLF